MQQRIAEDLRIPQIINIVKSISISADMMRLSKIFITEDNEEYPILFDIDDFKIINNR